MALLWTILWPLNATLVQLDGEFITVRLFWFVLSFVCNFCNKFSGNFLIKAPEVKQSNWTHYKKNIVRWQFSGKISLSLWRLQRVITEGDYRGRLQRVITEGDYRGRLQRVTQFVFNHWVNFVSYDCYCWPSRIYNFKMVFLNYCHVVWPVLSIAKL